MKSTFLLILVPFLLSAQPERNAGSLEMGIRNTYSTFSAAGYPGMGIGGQMRLRILERLNTEWFADWITTDIAKLGRRTDAHIGWSVLFYPIQKKKIEPYFIAGHCFDYTKVRINNTGIIDQSDRFIDRWSSAAQMGIGSHWHISQVFNFSLSSQYMVHLGSDVHTHIHDNSLHIEEHKEEGFSLEGHLLFTLSLNIKLGKLW